METKTENPKCLALDCELLEELRAIRALMDTRIETLLDRLTNTAWVSMRVHIITIMAVIGAILGSRFLINIIEGTARASGF